MRGRVPFAAGDRALALRLTTNALCDLEAEAGVPVARFFAGMGEGMSLRDLRLAFRHALEGDWTTEAAGEVIDALGMAPAVALLGRAVEAAFGADEGGDTVPARAPAPGK